MNMLNKLFFYRFYVFYHKINITFFDTIYGQRSNPHIYYSAKAY